jgi:putative SOS response-associated peptidase YedK
MIPSTWSRPLADLPTAFNARAEELSAKPFWAQSFESRRCLVPTTGYREFQGPRGKRRPFQFHQQPPLFAFGGVWDRWKAPDGAVVTSFAIVTVAANDVVLPVHDRMPLRVSPQAYEAWLSPALSGEQALGVALGAAVSPLLSYEANPVGNDSRREGPECIEPAARRQLKLF